MATTKPVLTRTANPLSFDQLEPGQFERLCIWLVEEEKFEEVEHFGEAGSEGGRDVVASKGGRRWVFQCKRMRRFSLADATTEIAKLRALPPSDQPDELVFVVSRGVRADTRTAIRAVWGEERPATSGAATSWT